MELSSLDVYYLVKDMQKILDAKIEKVFQSQSDRMDIMLQLYLKGWPKLYLRCKLPGMVCLQTEKPAYPQVPPGFAMFLRKYLSGARLIFVKQRGFDRIVELGFVSKHGELTLILELLAPGNALLVMDGVVKNLAQNQRYKDRTVRGGVEYAAPEPAFNLVEVSEKEIVTRLHESTRDSIVKSLAISVGLGGVYAEEVCHRAGIDKDSSNLKKTELQRIAETVKTLLEQKEKTFVDDKRAYPFKIESRPVSFDENSFMQALGKFAEPTQDKVKAINSVKVKKSKAEAMLKAQTKQQKNLLETVETDNRRGEIIYENYQIVSDIVRLMKEKNFEELEKIPQVKKIHKKTGEVEVDL